MYMYTYMFIINTDLRLVVCWRDRGKAHNTRRLRSTLSIVEGSKFPEAKSRKSVLRELKPTNGFSENSSTLNVNMFKPDWKYPSSLWNWPTVVSHGSGMNNLRVISSSIALMYGQYICRIIACTGVLAGGYGYRPNRCLLRGNIRAEEGNGNIRKTIRLTRNTIRQAGKGENTESRKSGEGRVVSVCLSFCLSVSVLRFINGSSWHLAKWQFFTLS